MRDLSDLGERVALKTLVWPTIAATQGRFVGEDTAVLDYTDDLFQLITVDAGPQRSFLEFLGVGSSRDVGHYAASMSLSDIAAMGGRSRFMVAAVLAPPTMNAIDLQEVILGLHEGATGCGCAYVGGDTKEGTHLRLVTTVVGDVSKDRILLRSTATPGDRLFVSRPLGATLASYVDAARGASSAIRRFEPEVALGIRLAEEGLATSCLDLSDGPIAGATQLAEMSQLAIELDCRALINAASWPNTSVDKERWERLILSTGSDFALMFTVPAGCESKAAQLGAVECGRCYAGPIGATLAGAPEGVASWEHFRSTNALTEDLLCIIGSS